MVFDLGIFGILSFLLGVIFSSILIFVPLVGALIRFRANYVPKPRVQLDFENGLEPPSGATDSSYFGMLMRVKKLEGWAGLYKGTWPAIIQSVCITSLIAPFASASVLNRTMYSTSGLVGLLITGFIASVVAVPFTILINRSIVTPHMLSFWNVRKAISILFTERERRNPLVLLLTPGLLVTHIVHGVIISYGLALLRYFLLPETFGQYFKDIRSAVPLIIYLCCAMGSVAFVTPMEVMIVRLSVQRNHGDNEAPAEVPEYTGLEDVIELRADDSDEDPYIGMFDCAKKIVNEEGWKTLYRGWWITLLGMILTAFAR